MVRVLGHFSLKTVILLACENGEERGETDVFAGYYTICPFWS